MENKILKLVIFMITFLSLISFTLGETHAECNTRCFRENSECCRLHSDECGKRCFDEARKCYRDCNNLIYLTTDE